MEWQLSISDVPDNAAFPIKGYQITDGGIRRGPYYFKVEDIIFAMQQQAENLFDADNGISDEASTPTLPLGTIRYSTNDNKNKHRVTMILDKKVWEIRYGNEPDLFSIGFPKMILQYLVVPIGSEKYRISEMRIYAVLDDKKPITDETPLFRFPYPNVGKENGIVCWGQNQRLEINSLTDLERSFFWFVSAPFNEDHGVRTTLGIGHFRKLIEKIKDLPFDDEWLMPLNKTFGELF